MSYRVAVIGGGLAGAVAALSAVRRGVKVILITKGAGASALSGGALDICGSPISAPGLPWARFLSVRDNLHETIARMPHHPYSVLALNNPDDPTDGLMAMIEEAFGFLREELFKTGLGLQGDALRQRPAPSMLGTWKLTSFVQSCQQLGVPEGDAAVAGIKGLSAPDANSLAASLQITLAATGLGSGEPIEHFDVELEGRETWTMEEAAEHLAVPKNLDAFLEKIAAAAGDKYRIILIPPSLPSSALSAELRLKGGAVVREMLATQPSAPGRRMQDALSAALEAAGIEVARGEARELERNGQGLVSCSVGHDGARRRIQADNWVLATGKFIAGGIKKDRSFRETALDLPLFCGDQQVGEVFTQKMLRSRVLGDHPAFGVGLMSDRRLRPVDQDGRVILENLFAAGSVLGGYNYHTGGCGLGVCALTGYRAGLEAAG